MDTGEKIFNGTPIAYALKTRIDKWDLTKLQRLCKAKDTVNKTKWQPKDWEKIFTNSKFKDYYPIYTKNSRSWTPEDQIILLKMGYRTKQ